MSLHHGTETEFELTTIERLKGLGYKHLIGMEIQRQADEVVLKDLLRDSLTKRYPKVPAKVVDEAVAQISRPQGVDPLRRNMAFHQMLGRGFELPIERPGGRKDYVHIHPIDWQDPSANDFHVVNQLPIHGQNDRRPDIVIYVNGLPLVVFELKNPYAEEPSVEEAFNQIQHYRNEIPQLFDTCVFAVISDGVNTLHGVWPATFEWFAPWKSINGFDVEPTTTGSMKMLIEGLFPKDRLLSYLRDFIVFEVANDIVVKKGAKYHQFFAVRVAAEKAVQAFQPGADKRIGVIWHTTGSGKSLSMAFLVAMLRRRPELQNPTFLLQVDRTDLDNQLHDQFVAARSLVGDVRHADSVEELRKLLQTQGGEVIFTTIEKFRLQTNGEGVKESVHPVISERSNIIVLADEAHRSQYGFLQGYARYLSEALPNAKRLGFTGTPVSLAGADTVEVFGEVIHAYDIEQSQLDRSTVPIFYAPRQIKLHLNHTDVDAALKEIASSQPVDEVEKRKGRWAALAAAAGSKERMERLAKDLLSHYLDRSATLAGKAMAVCMTRENCVRLYDALKALPGCPEIKVVMTGNLGKDPKEWSAAGHYTTKAQREAVKKRMVDPDDPLKIVIVCDMWLTGTDIPCLHTLYIDKPMQGHSVIQAISRVNRIFRDKPHGLVVDYIGIGDELREATNQYTKGGGKGDPAPDIEGAARPLFEQSLAEIRELLPFGRDYNAWRRLSRIKLEDLYSEAYGHLAEHEDRRDSYLNAEHQLTSVFLLVKHLEDCRRFADEVIFFQRVRKQIVKTLPGRRPDREVEKAVRDLVDDAVESQEVVDIFKAAGIEKADISILDDRFLQTFKDKPLENLRLALLERLVRDEIQCRWKKNLTKARSFKELLEETLRKYHNRLIDAAAVVQAMLQIRKDFDNEDVRAKNLNLESDELAFYDAVSENFVTLYDQAFLRDLIHDVVQTIKRSLKVDWTEPHREDVKAEIRAAVKLVLRKRNIRQQDFDPIIGRVMKQAEALYADWPLAA